MRTLPFFSVALVLRVATAHPKVTAHDDKLSAAKSKHPYTTAPASAQHTLGQLSSGAATLAATTGLNTRFPVQAAPSISSVPEMTSIRQHLESEPTVTAGYMKSGDTNTDLAQILDRIILKVGVFVDFLPSNESSTPPRPHIRERDRVEQSQEKMDGSWSYAEPRAISVAHGYNGRPTATPLASSLIAQVTIASKIDGFATTLKRIPTITAHHTLTTGGANGGATNRHPLEHEAPLDLTTETAKGPIPKAQRIESMLDQMIAKLTDFRVAPSIPDSPPAVSHHTKAEQNEDA